MKRIAVIGCGSSGKSHLARQLGAALGLPVTHLDAVYHDEAWNPLPKDESRHGCKSAIFNFMGAAENKTLLQDIFEQMAQGNTRALTDAMAEDFRWIFPGSRSWSGTWGPRQVVLDELLRPLFAQFADRYQSHAELVLADEDRVVVQTRGRVTTKRGDEYHNTYCYIFRVAEGKLTEVIEHCDTALVERVLDAPPAAPKLVR